MGANVDCEPQHLLQFAEMGHALVAAVQGKERPTIGLLNIGEEVIKGNETISGPVSCYVPAPLNFYGNVEGNDIFKGTTDVVVCDGFVGNVALKTSKGLAQMLNGMIKEELLRVLAPDSADGARRPGRCWRAWGRARVEPSPRYNGAALLGLRGVVIKSHGSADAFAFEWAIKRGYDAVKNGVQERLDACHGGKRPSAGAGGGGGGPPPPPLLLPRHNGSNVNPYSRVIGTGSYLPSTRVSNQALADQLAARGVETSDEWIHARTGIRARHFAAPDVGYQRPCARRIGARDRGGGHRPGVDRPDHRRHLHPGLRVSEYRLPAAGQARYPRQRRRLRRASRLLRLRVRASPRPTASFAAAWSAPHWWVGAETFSRILDFNDRTTWCCSATAPVRWCCPPRRNPACSRAPCTRTDAMRASSALQGTSNGGAIAGNAFLHMDGQAVFKLAVNVLEKVTIEALAKAELGVLTSWIG